MRAEARVLPELFLERLRRLVPGARWDAVCNTFTTPKPTTFRVNRLKASPETVRAQLTEAGFRLERVPWYADASLLRGGRLRDLQTTDGYQSGAIYVQSLSSMLPPLVLDPQPGESVLDLTAAPGSKTTQMACLMRGEGRLLANDNNKVRFFKLRANVEQQGARNVELSLADGLALGRRFPEVFDRVLVDAPCSAEGRFLTSEPASFRFWKPAKIREMVHKQKPLLYAGLTALRPGGVLVYSTCTFAPEENEAVVSWALKKFPGAVTLEPVTLGCPNAGPGLARWEEDAFPPAVSLTRRIWPTDEMEGFFIARFRKSASTVGALPQGSASSRA